MNKDKIEGGIARQPVNLRRRWVARSKTSKPQGKGFTTKPPVLPRTHMGKLRTW